jgi:cbb3-type cytochrome oxidase maturation protein
MEVIFILLPLAILMAGGALAAFFWAAHRGQFDDLDTPRYRALFDDDAPLGGVAAPSENKRT